MLNVINRYFYFVIAAVLVLLLMPNAKVRLNRSAFLLVAVSMCTLLFDPNTQDRVLDMVKPFAYPLCYVLGTSVFTYRKGAPVDLQKEEKNISTAICVIAGGPLLRFILNMITNWGSTNRNVIDFWTKSEMAATGQAALACMAIAVAVAFLFSKAGNQKKIIGAAILLAIITYNLILAGRTIFVLILLIMMVAILYRCITEKIKIGKAVTIILVVLLVLVLLYNNNVFGIKTTVESSNFYLRFYGDKYSQELDEDSRLEYKLAYLSHFLDYPWGGYRIYDALGHSAHDLYLDLYSEAGVFAFIAIIAYIISSLSRMVKCLRSPRFTSPTKLLILCVYIACNIQFWLEPITRGMPWLLAAYCFIDGTITYLLMREQDSLDRVAVPTTVRQNH